MKLPHEQIRSTADLGASSLRPNRSKVSFRETENHFKPSNSAARVPFVPTQRAPPCLRLLHVKSLTRYELRQRHTYLHQKGRETCTKGDRRERERQVGRRRRTRTLAHAQNDRWLAVTAVTSPVTMPLVWITSRLINSHEHQLLGSAAPRAENTQRVRRCARARVCASACFLPVQQLVVQDRGRFVRGAVDAPHRCCCWSTRRQQQQQPPGGDRREGGREGEPSGDPVLPQPLSPALCPPPSTALCYPRASSETHHHHHQPSFIAFSLSLSVLLQLWTSSSFVAFFNLPAGPQSEA